jgi:sigma-B regulation protein RsbU (phosphoserine phosphatase)
VRLIIGDVRGKGLEAVQLAAAVIGGFRQAAYRQPHLTSIAEDLDALVQAVAGEEDFVTALLAEFHDDHTVTLVNCGHHPPTLILPDGEICQPPAAEPVPPLGLSPIPSPVASCWSPGSRMLLYTDGLVEARDSQGTFFPLRRHVPALQRGTFEDALDRLVAELVKHTGHHVTDDLALVIAENRSS